MSGWRRLRQRLSRSREPEQGTYEIGGSTTLGDTIERARNAAKGHAGSRQNWSVSAWDAYRYTPEVRAAVKWLTNAMSRVRLYAAWIPEDGGDPQPIEDTPENWTLIKPVKELFGGPLQQAAMMRQWYLYRLVAGECIIAAVRPTVEERSRYGILDEWLWMVTDASPVTDTTRNQTSITLTWETVRGRITRRFDPGDVPDDIVFVHDRLRDPEFPEVTDSPTRAILDDAEVLRNVADSVNALSLSRIATAPVVAVSADVTIPGFGGPATPEDEDPVMAGFVDTMGQRVEYRRDPISRTPLVFRTAIRSDKAPVGNAVEVLDMAMAYDERTIDILDWEARRVAIGYSVPAEVTSGTADPNHWNALYEGMDGARIVIAPDAAEFSRLMTEAWYQWRLATQGVPNARISRVTMWYDASALVQDPDRSATLIELRKTDPALVTSQEVRRASGLPGEPDEQDASPQVTVPTSGTAGPSRTNGVTPTVPSIPGSAPVIRSPGFPTAARRA